jgi:hypothetical protein
VPSGPSLGGADSVLPGPVVRGSLRRGVKSCLPDLGGSRDVATDGQHDVGLVSKEIEKSMPAASSAGQDPIEHRGLRPRRRGL